MMTSLEAGTRTGVGAARDVDAAAPPDFDVFFAEQSAPLVRLGFLLVGDVEQARDCAQDVLTAMYARWGRFAAYGQAVVYARTALVNRTRDHHRRRQVASRRGHLLEYDAVLAGVARDEIAAVVERSALWPHLRELPTRQREVLVLRYWLDLGEREIAETLGVRPGTVKTSASRGLRTLQQRMGTGQR